MRLTLHMEHVGPRGMLFGAMPQALAERPQLFQTPGWVKLETVWYVEFSLPLAGGSIVIR